ncbi:BTAD domain-containing putative transcriptional regulator [Egicoccus sp. AB-alg2]|uniref:BTAD domain-containing putative transcriptional regulator n=1 Tax=Egicoccus sp. AB-alg2 TaxID=3242693 RepID=UPI00359CCF80
MAALEVFLFGGFQLRRDGEAVAPLPSRAARSLFAHLVLDRGTRHPRERLAAQFWPELPAARARRRLSHTLWQIQDTLGELPGGWDHLQTTSDAIALDRDAPCWVDVEEFERRLDHARAASGGPARAATALPELEQAVELYRGDFLAGHYDDWVLEEQQRLSQRYLDALTKLVAAARSSGAFEDALVYARRLTHQDPLREDAHREVMRLCMLLGRASDALRQYERCREVLAEELGTEPAAATEQLYQRILQERGRDDAPAAPAPSTAFPDRLPLAGRDAERAEGVRILEEALAGRGGSVLVEADAGYGKTRLLAEVVDDANWRGCKVLQTVCRGPEVAGPYTAVRQLLEPALTALRVEQLRHRVEPVWLGVVAQLLPNVARALGPHAVPVPSVRGDEAAQRLRHALVRTITALSTLDPLLVVVDDLQWADEASLQVIGDLAAETRGHHLAVVLGYRGEEARERSAVWGAVRELDRRARPARLVLGPLDLDAVGDIVRLVGTARDAEEVLTARLHQETGGHPLFVVETLRTLAETPELRFEHADGDPDVASLPLPATIRDLVLARLAPLDDPARALVEVAAVGGEGTALDTMVTALELPRGDVVDAADLLVRRALLCEVDDGFGLRHQQLRRVVLDALPDRRLRTLHRRVGEALEDQQPDALDRLAHHFSHADEPRKAVHYLREAGRAAAAVHAYATADEYYARAVEIQRRRPASVAARFELLADHEAVLDVLGDRDRQQAVVDELITLADGSPRRELEALQRRALLTANLGAPEQARADARRAVELATAAGEDLPLASARFALARVLAWAGERRAALPLFVRAVRTGAVAPALAVEIRTTLASVLREMQRYRAAEIELDAALSLARAHDETREEAQALGVLGTVLMETGRAAEATDLYGQAIERCRTIGLRRAEGIHLLNQANAHYVRGLVGQALPGYEAAAEIFAQLGDRRGEAAVRFNLGVVLHAVLGDDERATVELSSALRYFQEVGDPLFEASCRDALIGVALRRGDIDAAQEQLDAAFALPDVSADAIGHVQLIRREAELFLATGDGQAALTSAREAVASARQHDLLDVLPLLLGLEGRIRLANGDATAAVAATAAAVDALHDGVERPHLIWLVHHEALRAAGRSEEAGAAAAEAAQALDTLLEGLSASDRSQAEGVPEHRRIFEAVEAPARPGHTRMVVASRSAPRGRALHARELVEVEVDVSPGPDAPAEPIERRQWLLQHVARQITEQDGAPTTADLATLLEVSEATVRRDLQALRAAGRDVETRGARAG